MPSISPAQRSHPQEQQSVSGTEPISMASARSKVDSAVEGRSLHPLALRGKVLVMLGVVGVKELCEAPVERLLRVLAPELAEIHPRK